MNPSSVKDSSSDLSDRLVRVLEEYLTAVPLGTQPTRQDLLEAHPELAGQLDACLGTLDFIQRAAVDTPSGSSDETTQLTGRPLGDFRIVRELGRGGMGVVYEAEQQSIGRRVALKVLPFAAVLDKRQLNRFKNEVQAAGQLRHPNIVGVYAVGCERGVHYFAMELIDGQNLAEMIDQLHGQAADPDACQSAMDQLTRGSAETQTIAAMATDAPTSAPAFFRDVARVGAQVADALHYAHEMGVIHRDIKPSNLLVSDDGNIWVTDFGLAHVQSESNLTMSNDLLGTLRYMSPEQAAGGNLLDQRTDVYSLGLTLKEMLTGKPAFGGNDRQEIIRRILEDAPRCTSRFRQSVPRDLQTILLKATAKDRDDRYPTATALAADLRRFLDDRPISARRPSLLERSRRWVRRNRMVATLLTTVFLLLALLSAGSLAVAWRATQQAASREELLYARDMNLVAAALEQGDFPAAERRLLRWDNIDGGRDLRGIEWDYLWRRCHTGAAHNQIENDSQTLGVAYSVNGTRLAISNALSRAIHVRDARNGRIIQTLTSPKHMVAPLFRQAGKNRLVAGDNGGHVSIWDFDSLEQLESLTLPVGADESDVSSIAISSDDQFVAVGVGPIAGHGTKCASMIQVWDRQAKKWIRRDGFIGKVHVAFLRTDAGERLITGCYQNTVKLWDTARWQVVRDLSVPAAQFVSAITVSPDGSLLATASAKPRGNTFQSRIDVWSTNDWTRLHSLSRHEDVVSCLSFSADGRLLAGGGHDGGISLIDPTTGETSFFASAHQHKIHDLTFSPDDKYLCSAGGKDARIWRVRDLLTTPQSDLVLTPETGVVVGAVFLDEGSTLCTVAPGGNVVVWDTDTGQVINRFRVEYDNSGFSRAAVSPDKKWLAVHRVNWPPRDVDTKLEMFSIRRAADNASPALALGSPPRTNRAGEGEGTFDSAARLLSFESKYSVLLPSSYNASTFSSNSSIVAVPLPDTLMLLKTETGKLLGSIGPIDPPVQCPAFSPDDRLLVIGSGSGTTYVYDVDELELVTTIKTDVQWTKAVAFSPDGTYFATGGSDEVIRYWDASSYREIPVTGQCTDAILHMAFSRDGRRLLSASADSTLRIWKPLLEDELLTLRLQSIWPLCGEFSADGSSIVSGAGATAVVFRAADRSNLHRLNIERLPHFGCER